MRHVDECMEDDENDGKDVVENGGEVICIFIDKMSVFNRGLM